jgi:hypothetical protein
MTEFNWKARPDEGNCILCMSHQNDRGFVDMIGEVHVKNDHREIVGVVDILICANCLEQAAVLVGSPTAKMSGEMAYREAELLTEIEKLKDEVQAWQQRVMGLANLSLNDLRRLAELEEEAKPDSAEGDEV